ncbi:CtsR family transcriptional regulator [Alicyclobacillus macrosporangiidus]|uniref:Transcriptional regulator CtsR n=1 Tax=Alicyclobacillus macrosporangiidus TaxID=392015 RepID=A0A1I7I503_9BACL|nr:CtsR family transcriptional regulator [Alicyclobacillus macrosporangiidus]SFU68050.1 transcriptional regulator CtsR [Alicyclobacillus macrosporangiidus]
MGNNISDIIERYLKRILQQSQSGVIEVQRSELAELFQCVPSQINYVISTRFSVDHGYVVESKRGGGGYIRIRRIDLDEHAPLVSLVRSMGSTISQREAESVIDRLRREQVVSEREAAMLRAAVRREVLNVDLPYRDELRARLLTQMLLALSAAVQRAEDDARPQR